MSSDARAVGHPLIVCVDFGSTFTKAALVDVERGLLVATASHRTTVDTDVLEGWVGCLADLVRTEPRAQSAPVRACSSAGGGLRIAVVGNEELVTSEAGRRVALSSGGHVVAVVSGGLDEAGLAALTQARVDVVLLVGGTDGGDTDSVRRSAATLAAATWTGPVVVAGNVDARDEVAGLLGAAGTPHVLADNVVPQIGVLAPASARTAIREVFLRHVIGGKHLSRSGDFAAMVRGATPDVVLTGVELLARGVDAAHPGAGDVVVVDVGGATTDVPSVVEVDPEESRLSRQVVATTPVTRTVEGDLGMRWSAVTTIEQGVRDGLVDEAEAEGLRTAARRRGADPALVPAEMTERALDARIASVAVAVALRRHAGRSQVVFGPDGRVVERTGKDLRAISVLVGSGGVLRHSDHPEGILGGPGGPSGPGVGWQLPESPRLIVDRDCVLAAAGLLAVDHPRAAYALLGALR